MFAKNIMTMLSSNFLPHLQQLRVLRLCNDINCIPPQLPFDYFAFFLKQALNQPHSEDDAVSILFDPADLKDYLGGWNRYCPRLRTVQLTSVSLWHRQLEGDPWVERAVDPPLPVRPTTQHQSYRQGSDPSFA